ncbi:MAG TPA: RCC1 repeat-containing protein [Polyangia bacterium]|nr:RCC1 repeat-containing protein [Polyangia bacterium]
MRRPGSSGVVGLVALLAGVLSAGCLGTPSFVCHADAQCGTDAFCESDGHCSARDPACPSRRRYLGAAGDRANACVPATCADNPIVALSAGGAHACLLRQDGHVTCWGRNSDGQLGDGTLTPRSSGGRVTGLEGAVALASGDRHACAVVAAGAVACWGADDTGQLGDGGGPDRLTPVTVPGVVGAAAVAAGAGFSCALLNTGGAVCWGDDRNGELGDGAPATVLRGPTAVAGLPTATALSANGQHACAILADGSLVCWGNNATGQLGDGTLVNRPRPAVVAGLHDVHAVATGLSHTCALSDAGLSCWGSNSQGQLGTDTGTSAAPVTAPVPVPLVASPVAIAAGAQHTCAVRSTGAVLCWGQNGTGQLGEGSMSSLAEPVPVTGLDTGLAVTAGTTFSCARTTDGAVFCWGDDHDGELGTGRGVTARRPVALPVAATAIAAGGAHTCAVTPSATTTGGLGFACWGSNQAGQLGDNDGDDRAHPAPIEQPLVAGTVTAGALHTCAVDASGGLWCWGRGSSGQIGPARMVDTMVPVRVPLPAGATGASSAAAGDAHTCAAVAGPAGTPLVACFGANDRGQLGDGTTTARATPAAVAFAGVPPVAPIAVAAGGGHTCLTDGAGRLWCWGRGDRGQLGTGAAGDDPSPGEVALPGSDTAASVATGQAHTCAVDDQGRVWCWGANDRGQLGTGTAGPDVPAPAPVAGLPGPAVEVSAGGAHSCAALKDGRIFCWGANESGQLGDGTWADRARPAPVPGATGTVEAGQAHTCAFTADGHAACWGADNSGQLGDGVTLTISAPQLTQVACP